MPLLHVPRVSQFPCPGDVVGLAGLVAAAQQQDELIAPASQIDAISGAEGEAQLQDAATHRLHSTDVAASQPIETGHNPKASLPVLELAQPTIELLRGENLDQVSILVDTSG